APRDLQFATGGCAEDPLASDLVALLNFPEVGQWVVLRLRQVDDAFRERLQGGVVLLRSLPQRIDRFEQTASGVAVLRVSVTLHLVGVLRVPPWIGRRGRFSRFWGFG